MNECKHPPERYFCWYARDDTAPSGQVLVITCRDCGAVLKGAAELDSAADPDSTYAAGEDAGQNLAGQNLDGQKRRLYWQGLVAVDPGACNLSGLAETLQELLPEIEMEQGGRDDRIRLFLTHLLADVRKARESTQSTEEVNTNKSVTFWTRILWEFAYGYRGGSPVSHHPTFRLITAQMAFLAGISPENAAYYDTLYQEAKAKARAIVGPA